MQYKTTSAFEKDFKKLLKKFKTLHEDLEIAKHNAIELFHQYGINNEAIFPIQNFCSNEIKICKLKKFACKALKGFGIKSGIRVVYAFHSHSHLVEFIEIYFKGDFDNENKERIKEYLKGSRGN